MKCTALIPLVFLCSLQATAGTTNDTIAITAENAPVTSVVDEVLKKQKINFVYSNSRLGIGTNRPPKIDIRVTRRVGKSVKEKKQ